MQFDVFTNPVPASRRDYPLVVVMQSALLAEGSNQIVAPLAPHSHVAGASNRLLPAVRIDDNEYVVFTPRLMTLPAGALSRRTASLARYRDVLLGAVDLLFYGV